MKRIILSGMLFLIFISFISLYAQWAGTYGGSLSDDVHSFQQTTDGGYIVAGSTNSFGAGSDDFWILKFTSDGGIEWQKTYGGSVNDVAHSIQQTSDGGYIVAGETSSFGTEGQDIWVLKLASDGGIEWQRTYGGDEVVSASSIRQTVDGGYIVVARIHTIGEDKWGNDIWILKLTSDGDIEWQKTYGGNRNDTASFLQQRSDGGYIVVGHTESFGAGGADIWILKLSPAGNIEWQKTYGGSEDEVVNSFQQTSDGGYIAAGRTESFGAGENDFWILKLTSDGDIEWQKTYGESEGEGASSIQQTIDGGYIVAGSTNIYAEWGSNSRGNIWILKLSSTGATEWKHAYGGGYTYSASSIRQTSDGGYIVTGGTHISDAACRDFNSLILKLSSTGDIEWQKTCGGIYSEDVVYFIQQTSDEGYIVVGRTNSWNAWGEIWIFKLLPNGDINPSCAFIKNWFAQVLDTDVMPEDSDMTPEDTGMIPEDTDITPQDTNITPQDSNANECDLCSEECTLILSASSEGTTEPAPGSHTYATGTRITLKAVPSSGASFDDWVGNIDCEENPITITMDGDKSIKATFHTPGPGGGEGITSSLGLGKCFIATAAYGSPLHPHVRILRDFRDRYLITSKLGREVVNLYYKYSPYIAELIAKHNILRVAVRLSLLPLIAFSYSMVHFGPIITVVILVFISVFPIFLILLSQGKLRRVEAKDPKALASLD
jgi:uncharacterized delta-60 repeat protein